MINIVRVMIWRHKKSHIQYDTGLVWVIYTGKKTLVYIVALRINTFSNNELYSILLEDLKNSCENNCFLVVENKT